MSLDLSGPDVRPIESVDELIAWMRAGEKPRERWRVGVEHEKIGLLPDGQPVAYPGEHGIRALLEGLSKMPAQTASAHLHSEDGNPIAWLDGMASVTLEPGGQLELSGAPFRTLREAEVELKRHLDHVRAWSEPRGVHWLAVGYRPEADTQTAPWMPKLRYGAMRRSLGPKGGLALDMMLMTATVQANLDFADEADLRAKCLTSTRVSPIVTALFANSAIRHGRSSGMLDFRYQVWRDTDNARCGLLESMLNDDFGYRAYVEWALDVPLLFVRHEGKYLDGKGMTFRQWMKLGEVAGLSMRPTLTHWMDHLTTLFPEVRVKRVIELRGADVVPMPYLMSLPAIWMGLLYDAEACRAAADLTRAWTFKDLLQLQLDVARSALHADAPGGKKVLDVARELLAIARAGLGRWQSVTGADERPHLDPLDELARTGKTLAERGLEAWDANRGSRSLIQGFGIA